MTLRVALILLALFVPNAAFADRDKDLHDCEHEDSDAGIPACTRIIERGKEKSDVLSTAYSRRCKHYTFVSLDKAIADCTRAIQLNPLNAAAYEQRASDYADKELYDRALADYATSIKLDPKLPYNYYGRYYIYLNTGRLELALAAIDKFVELRPTSDNFRSRGLIYLKMKRYDKAIIDYTKGIELEPKSPHANADRADAYLAWGKLTEALKDADKSLELAPDNGLFWESRANVLVAIGRREEAIANYKKALSLDSSNRGIKERLNKLGIFVN